MRGGVNMASIKDVAQKAGVGVGTVSRVLNNSGYVSDETREKIEEAMKIFSIHRMNLPEIYIIKRVGSLPFWCQQ